MILTSLTVFLNTGKLGPLTPGVSLKEVARLLGPPVQWLPSGYLPVGPVPGYWRYRNHLEISFSFELAPQCNWFQIEFARSMRGKIVQVASDMVMSLDGLSGTSTISDCISAIADVDRVRIRLVNELGHQQPTVIVDDLEMQFTTDEEFYTPDMTMADLVRRTEAHAELDSIYSFDRDQYRLKRLARYLEPGRQRLLSGRDYLDLCRGERTRT